MADARQDCIGASGAVTQVSETARTNRYLPPVFFGQRVPPFPAEQPLPVGPAPYPHDAVTRSAKP